MSDVIWTADAGELRDLLETEEFVVIDFTAPAWCRPCQQFAPHFDRVASMLPGVTFVAVDVDLCDGWPTRDYGVRGVPSVQLFKHGEFSTLLSKRNAIPFITEIESLI